MPEHPDQSNVRHVLVVYCVHEESITNPVEDPLEPGAYNETATASYLSMYKWMGMSTDAWANDGFPDGGFNAGPPVAPLSLMENGPAHTLDVVHLGLDSGTDTIVNPYVVPKIGSTNPLYAHRNQYEYGRFVSQTPHPNFRNALIAAGLNPDNYSNLNGWLSEDDEHAIAQLLLLDILRDSDYINSVIPSDINISKNWPGGIDYVLLVLPPVYQVGYYYTTLRARANVAVLTPAITLGGQEINHVFWGQCLGYQTNTITHEYAHASVIQTGAREVFSGKQWVGDPTTFLLVGSAQDIYIEPPNSPAPDIYGGLHPCQSASQITSTWPGVYHPLQATALGVTQLNRWAVRNGDYILENFAGTYDCLNIQSPDDLSQILTLQLFFPMVMAGSVHYPYSGDYRYDMWGNKRYIYKRGIHATITKLKDRNSYSGTWSYSNFRRLPVATYMLDTMTEYYNYSSLNDAATRTDFNNIVTNNPIPVLLEHPPVHHPTGLSVDNEFFGVTVDWVGWLDANGAVLAPSAVDTYYTTLINGEYPTPRAKVTISGLPDWGTWVPDLLPEPILNFDDVAKIEIGWDRAGAWWDTVTVELDTVASFDSPNLVTEVFSVPNTFPVITDFSPATLYYLRLRFTSGNLTSAYSLTSSFTSLAVVRGQAPGQRYADGYKAGSTSDNTRLVQPDDLVVLTLPDEASQDEKVRVCKAKDLLPSSVSETFNLATTSGNITLSVLVGVAKETV